MNKEQKYRAYLYWCAKQGLIPFSFNAWKVANKPGRLF